MIPLPPRWMIFTGILAACALAIPPVVIARVRATPDENRAVHIFFDMDFQPKFKTQAETMLDSHLYEGAVNGKWAETLPEGMSMTPEFLARGQQRYNIYCSVCHGYAGWGDGTVNKRAMELMSNSEGPVQGTSWVQAKSLHDPVVREHQLGMLYNIATNGIRNMAGYGAQIDLEDRWAIAAYVKALQLSQDASLQDVPPELRANLQTNSKQGEVK